jgi:anti-sigma factor ChrR (cupin superfamily)
MTPTASTDPTDDDTAPAIDADVAALLDTAIGAVPLGPEPHARIRRRLLRRIAADATPRHRTLEAGQGLWEPFGSGVQIKVLHAAPDVMSYLLRLAPGASLPPHRHPVDEECVVLEGEIHIGALRFGAGSFHLGRKDVLHDRLSTEHGALIYLRGAPPVAEHMI